jgi:hypothetical protein
VKYIVYNAYFTIRVQKWPLSVVAKISQVKTDINGKDKTISDTGQPVSLDVMHKKSLLLLEACSHFLLVQFKVPQKFGLLQ